MARGMTDRAYTVDDILRERIFPESVALPPRWEEYYKRVVKTPALGKHREHTLTYAF